MVLTLGVYFLIYRTCLSLGLREIEYWNREGASQVRKGGSAKEVGQRDSVGLAGERLQRSQRASGRQMFELIWVYKPYLCCWMNELLMSRSLHLFHPLSVPMSVFSGKNGGYTCTYHLFSNFLWNQLKQVYFFSLLRLLYSPVIFTFFQTC